MSSSHLEPAKMTTTARHSNQIQGTNIAIDVVAIGRDVAVLEPLKSAFGAASTLLTMIKVRLLSANYKLIANARILDDITEFRRPS